MPPIPEERALHLLWDFYFAILEGLCVQKRLCVDVGWERLPVAGQRYFLHPEGCC